MKPKIPHLDRKSRVQSYRAVLITFFTLIQIQGLLSVGFGAWLLSKIRIFSCVFMDRFYSGSAILIATGCISIIMCTIGITRTIRYNTFPLFSHFIILYAVVLILEFSASITMTVNHVELHENFKQNVQSEFENIQKNFNGKNIDFTERSLTCWVDLQRKFECCGYTGYKNWITVNDITLPKNLTKYGLDSCSCQYKTEGICTEFNTAILNNSLANRYVFASSCYDHLMDELEFHSTFLRVYPPVLIVIQIVCFIIMSYFMNKIRNFNVIATYSVKEDKSAFSTEVISSRMDQCTL